MAALLEYIKNIGYFLILMSLVNNVMPDNSYKKYCRMFCGLILVVLVINPFYEFLNYEGDIEDIFATASYESQVRDLENQIKISENTTKNRAISEYESLIVKELQPIANKEGLYILEASVELIEGEEIQLSRLKLCVTDNVDDFKENDLNEDNFKEDNFKEDNLMNGQSYINGDVADSEIKIDKITIGNDSGSSKQKDMTNPVVLAFIQNVAEHLRLNTEKIVVEIYKGENYGE